jgi:hypothetical protein
MLAKKNFKKLIIYSYNLSFLSSVFTTIKQKYDVPNTNTSNIFKLSPFLQQHQCGKFLRTPCLVTLLGYPAWLPCLVTLLGYPAWLPSRKPWREKAEVLPEKVHVYYMMYHNVYMYKLRYMYICPQEPSLPVNLMIIRDRDRAKSFRNQTQTLWLILFPY